MTSCGSSSGNQHKSIQKPSLYSFNRSISAFLNSSHGLALEKWVEMFFLLLQGSPSTYSLDLLDSLVAVLASSLHKPSSYLLDLSDSLVAVLA